jgi:hypothetical protein
MAKAGVLTDSLGIRYYTAEVLAAALGITVNKRRRCRVGRWV